VATVDGVSGAIVVVVAAVVEVTGARVVTGLAAPSSLEHEEATRAAARRTTGTARCQRERAIVVV
jgi:hypothetical protein